VGNRVSSNSKCNEMILFEKSLRSPPFYYFGTAVRRAGKHADNGRNTPINGIVCRADYRSLKAIS